MLSSRVISLCLLSWQIGLFGAHLTPDHVYDSTGHKHSLGDDQRMFLGESLKHEFDTLSYKEAGRRLRLLIPHIDLSKDGFLDQEELEIWVRHKMKPLDFKDDVEALFREADSNFDEKMTWDEYTSRQFHFRDRDHDELSNARREVFKDIVKRDRRRWKFADVDKDGFLVWKEFEYFRHPHEHAAMTRLVAIEELEESDKDNDGYLSVEEYIKSIEMPSMRILDEKDFHEKWDMDHDRKLNLDEVERWKTPEEFDAARREAKHLIQAADNDKDGKLSIEEILNNQIIFVSSVATMHGTILHEEF